MATVPPPLRMPNVASALARSLVCQIIALAGMLMIINLFTPRDSTEVSRSLIPLLSALTGASISAAACAGMLGLTRPWKIGNALLPPAVILSLMFEIPGWLFVLLLLLPLTLYLPALFAQVPYYPSSSATIEKLLQTLPKDRAFTFIDLGCGFGEPLLSLARERPLGNFYGIDLSPLSIGIAWIRSLFRRNVRFRMKNLWTYPLSDYDFIYAFLAPPPMTRLGEKVFGEMRTDALLISNSFPIPQITAETLLTGDERQHTLFIYRKKH